MTARVAFKKRKVVHERVVWIVSVFENPSDIASHDSQNYDPTRVRDIREEQQSRQAHHHSRDSH